MLRLLSAITADGATHTNSTDEAVLASYSFPANSWQAGKVYKFDAAVECPSTHASDTLTLRVRIGGTTLTGTAMFTSNATDVADGDIAVISGTLVVRDADSSSTVAYMIAGSDSDAASEVMGAHAGTVASLDATAPILLEVTGDWSAANAANQVNALAFNVYEIV
jgi:hypothetical protein